MLAHLLIFGTYQAGKKYHIWERLQALNWIQPPRMITELLKKSSPQEELKAQEEERQPPLMFVEVTPQQTVTEAPAKAQYYSDRNSTAANPDPKEALVPRIEGEQTRVVKTEDVPRTKAFPLRPTPPPAEPDTKEEKEQKEQTPVKEQAKQDPTPKPPPTPGDLALLRPETRPPQTETAPQKPRRPTVKEAMAKLQNNQMSGQKMKQDGGVRRVSAGSSLDVVATGFGAYDAAFIAAIKNRWDDLLEDRRFSGDRTGKVQLRFRLNSDGSISQMNLMENTVDLSLALLCESAVRDPSPYPPWTAEMKKIIGENFREITITFWYY